MIVCDSVMSMKSVVTKVMTLLFCLSLMVFSVPGGAICIGEDGHAEFIGIGDHGCCSEDGAHTDSEAGDVDAYHLADGECCIDISLSVDSKMKMLPSGQSGGFKPITSYVSSMLPAFVYESTARKLAVLNFSARATSSLVHLRTTVLLV